LASGTVPDARFPATLPAISGANLTNLDASDLASGTLPDARFPATLPAISGANLTNLDASDLASGTVPDARFPATLPAISGANLTNLDASDLASGTVPVARLGAGTFSVASSTTTGATNNWAPTLAGNSLIEWNGASGAAFTGLDGGVTGQIVIIKNITAAQVATFAHASGSSDADNRFTNLLTSAATPIGPGGWIVYQHDGTNWKLIGHNQGTWITYTPTWTAASVNPAIGNGTLTGTYCVIGNVVHFEFILIAGSTTTFGTGAYSWALPFTITNTTHQRAFSANILDNGSQFYNGVGLVATATTIQVTWHANTGGVASPTTPMTWANGDRLVMSGSFEVS
jgi:hypothetical protein